MLGIDTILGTVCIVEKSIYSGGLVNVGRRPAFLYIENPWLDQGFDKALAMSL